MNMAIRVQLESFSDTHTFADVWNMYAKGREGGGVRVGGRVGGERYVHCMYANFVFALVKEGGCGGPGGGGLIISVCAQCEHH